MARPLIGVAIVALLFTPAFARAAPGDWSATLYGARISTQPGWEDIILDAPGTEFVDSYLMTAALSHEYAQRFDGSLEIEWAGQVAYNFGDESYWEFDAVPIILRWRKFPWSQHVATAAAFGLGLSYTSELPQVEVELEGESHQWLVYWLLELTAGPVDAPWAISLRIHHRSVAYGLMGDEGGMNAVGLGLRYRF
jgi:hypothetical protein